MLHHNNVYLNFAFIVVISYHEWPILLLTTLRKYSNNTIIIVNHLPTDIPDTYYDSNCVVLSKNSDIDALGQDFSHGSGIDAAINYIKTNMVIEYAVLIEPDCIVTGIEWLNQLVRAVYDYDAIMAGYKTNINSSSVSPLHICPSIWEINRIPGLFKIQKRNGFDSNDFSVLDYKQLLVDLIETNTPVYGIWIWCHFWDTGIKNWYNCAAQNKAIMLNNCQGFYHFFYGRYRPPRDKTKLSEQQLKVLEENDWIPEFTKQELMLLQSI